MTWVWVLIPLAAILIGGFKEWLSFQEKQSQLGDSTRELGQTLSSIRSQIEEVSQAQKSFARRIENIEVIVTSEAWDLAHDESISLNDRDTMISGAGLLDASEEESDEVKLGRIARRLRS